jgi:hypothetical protein
VAKTARYEYAAIKMGPLVYSTQLLYTTTHTTTLHNERPPFRPPAGVTAGGQLPEANTKRASSCSFCDKIVVTHILHREELSDECAAGTIAPRNWPDATSGVMFTLKAGGVCLAAVSPKSG